MHASHPDTPATGPIAMLTDLEEETDSPSDDNLWLGVVGSDARFILEKKVFRRAARACLLRALRAEFTRATGVFRRNKQLTC